jgi:hypothetical protein
MRAIEEDLVVEEDGLISLEELPVKMGDRVKVIVLLPDERENRKPLYSLRGLEPYRFVEPTAPVAPEDWE